MLPDSFRKFDEKFDKDFKNAKRTIIIVTISTIIIVCTLTYFIMLGLKPYIDKLDKKITQAADTTIVIKNGKADTTIIIHK